MTDTSHPGGTTRPSPSYSMSTNDVSGWAGWVGFAGIMLIMLGVFQVIEGLRGDLRRRLLPGPPERPGHQRGLHRVGLDYTSSSASSRAATGSGSWPATWSPASSVSSLPVISATLNLLFIGAYPVWSTIIIAVDVIVIYAIVVHGRELKSVPM